MCLFHLCSAGLNEDLVQCLLARDSHKREQESRLIDIEDLNRWIRMSESGVQTRMHRC